MVDHILNMSIDGSVEFLHDVKALSLYVQPVGESWGAITVAQYASRFTPNVKVREVPGQVAFAGGPKLDKLYTGSYAMFVFDRLLQAKAQKSRVLAQSLFTWLTTEILDGKV